MRSPTEMSMSSSRAFGFGEISFASRTSSSVVSPIAESDGDDSVPRLLGRDEALRDGPQRSTSATDVPPNFMTTVPARARRLLASRAAGRDLVLGRRRSHLSPAGEGAAERHFVGVLEVAADGQAAGEARHADAAAQPVGQVRGGRLAGHVRVRRQDDLLDAVALDAPDQLVDPQMLGLDAVDRRERAAEHVVQAPELVRPLEREQVGRLLDDADERAVAARVAADRRSAPPRSGSRTRGRSGLVLDVADRVGERERLLLRDAQQMEGEAVRRARADSRQARQLRDEVLDGRGEHGRIVPAGRMPSGWTAKSASLNRSRGTHRGQPRAHAGTSRLPHRALRPLRTIQSAGRASRAHLVVDDEASIRLICRVNLDASGFEVLEAEDGETAVSIARSEQPDLILLDVMLPGIDGVGRSPSELSRDARRRATSRSCSSTARSAAPDEPPGHASVASATSRSPSIRHCSRRP